jgi:hypothetical protein
MSYYDEHNDYQTDCANDDRWNRIKSLSETELVNACEKCKLITEEEIDVPMSEFKYSCDQMIEMLYDNDYDTLF